MIGKWNPTRKKKKKKKKGGVFFRKKKKLFFFFSQKGGGKTKNRLEKKFSPPRGPRGEQRGLGKTSKDPSGVTKPVGETAIERSQHG